MAGGRVLRDSEIPELPSQGMSLGRQWTARNTALVRLPSGARWKWGLKYSQTTSPAGGTWKMRPELLARGHHRPGRGDIIVEIGFGGLVLVRQVKRSIGSVASVDNATHVNVFS